MRLASEIIGRDEELGAIAGVPREVEQRSGRARALGRGRDRQDDPLGSGRRGGARALRPGPDLPRRRGRGVALLRRALRSARQRARGGGALARAPATARARDRAAARRAGRAWRRTRTRSGSPCSTCCVSWPSKGRCSSRSTTPSGSTRPPPPCCRSRFDDLRDEPIGLLATVRKAPERRRRHSSSSASFPDGRLERISLGPLSLARVHRLLEERLGLDLTRPELARVQEATAGNPFFALELGRELVRTNTRPAPGRALPMPESLAGAARRPPRPAARPRPSMSSSRSRRSPGRRSSWSRPRTAIASASSRRSRRLCDEGVVELDDSAHSLRASAARLDLLRAGAGLEAPCRASRARGGGDGRPKSAPAIWRSPQTAPTRRIASELETAAEHAAARGAPAAAAELCELAAELTPDDPALARQRRVRAATYHRLAGERRDRSRNSRAAPHRGPVRRRAVGRASRAWSGLSRPTFRRCSSSPTRLSPRLPTTMRARHGSWPFERGATS